MKNEHDALYEGRVVEAELEAIRLRADDKDKSLFWLWPPFGPTEEREKELTAPKVTLATRLSDLSGGHNLSAYQQQSLMQGALQNSIQMQNMQNRNQMAIGQYGLAALFGGLK